MLVDLCVFLKYLCTLFIAHCLLFLLGLSSLSNAGETDMNCLRSIKSQLKDPKYVYRLGSSPAILQISVHLPPILSLAVRKRRQCHGDQPR